MIGAGKLGAIAAGSHSFATAARLFEPATRDSVVQLYAWCRHCDDVIDEQVLGHDGGTRHMPGDPLARLAILESETRAALAGEGSEPVFAGLALVVRRHGVPPWLPLEHLAGYRMDAERHGYRSIDDTLVYCYRVAGVVGVIMAHVMGVRDRAVIDRACDLGIAFQLTNIARDVVPDAQNGRIYLPQAWLDEAGIPRAEIGAAHRRRALAGLAGRLVTTAEPYYRSALVGIGRLPARAAWAVATARGVYRDIGLEVVRRGPRAWDTRVSTSARRKLGHVACWAIAAPFLRGFAATPRDGLWTRPDGQATGLAAEPGAAMAAGAFAAPST